MRYGIAIVLGLCLLMGADLPKDDAAPAADALNGVWQLSSGESDGKKLSETQLKEGKLVIEGNQYKVTLADRGTVTGTQELDSTKSPKTIDITDASGTDEGETCLGIYELKGDVFRVVFASAGGDRPLKFETTPDSGQWMHVWKRIAE
jgi:uncharacterized protein (TIGR03067 family)